MAASGLRVPVSPEMTTASKMPVVARVRVVLAVAPRIRQQADSDASFAGAPGRLTVGSRDWVLQAMRA